MIASARKLDPYRHHIEPNGDFTDSRACVFDQRSKHAGCVVRKLYILVMAKDT